jgi:hypothetical protein
MGGDSRGKKTSWEIVMGSSVKRCIVKQSLDSE